MSDSVKVAGDAGAAAAPGVTADGSGGDRQKRYAGGRMLRWVVVCLVVAIVLFGVFRRKPKPLASGMEVAVAVRCVTVAPQAVADIVRLPGTIEAWADVVLGIEKPGRITEVFADRGDRVTAGQVLLRIDARAWTAHLRQAEVELREAQKDLARWKEMLRSGAISESEMDAAQRRFDVAEAAHASAAAHVSQCEVRTPIDGRVEDRMVDAGEFAGEGKAAFRVLAMDRCKLVADVPERDIGAVQTNQVVVFRATAAGTGTFHAVVTFVAESAQPENNAYRMEAAVDNPDGVLKAGMIAELDLVRGTQPDAMVVPLAAVLPQQGEHVVYVVVEGRAVRRVVRVARIQGEQAVLDRGVAAGDRLVVEGARMLGDGAAVKEM